MLVNSFTGHWLHKNVALRCTFSLNKCKQYDINTITSTTLLRNFLQFEDEFQVDFFSRIFKSILLVPFLSRSFFSSIYTDNKLYAVFFRRQNHLRLLNTYTYRHLVLLLFFVRFRIYWIDLNLVAKKEITWASFDI